MTAIPQGESHTSGSPAFLLGRKSLKQNGGRNRPLAELSKEPVFVNAFNNGWDVHSYGAEILYGQKWKDAAAPGCAYYEKGHKKCECPKHQELRDGVKACNFGIALL